MEIQNVVELFKGKSGIEIGGLSRIFKEDGAVPVYPVIENLDGCNFSKETLWEHGLQEGLNYNFYGNKVGFQFICEATELELRIEKNKYDFLISSNCLEHIANPLKALTRFNHIVKTGGIVLLVLPKKEATFDRNRQITTYTHLYEDYKNNIGEENLYHLDEILQLHDLSMDPPAGNLEQFRERSLQNYYNRGLHHHVFDLPLLSTIYKSVNIEEIFAADINSDYIIVGRKYN